MFKLERWYDGKHGDAMCAVYMFVSYNHHTLWLALAILFSCIKIVAICPIRFANQAIQSAKQNLFTANVAKEDA